MAGDSSRPYWQTERDDRGQFETVRSTAELLFNADRKVAKTRSWSGRSHGILVVIRSRETQFRAWSNSNSNERLGEIDSTAPLIARIEHAVFALEHPAWNDRAGVCDGGPISRNRRRSTTRIGRLCRGDWNDTSTDEHSWPDHRTAPENYDSRSRRRESQAVRVIIRPNGCGEDRYQSSDRRPRRSGP